MENNKFVLITGSSGGLGRSLAIKFAKEGYGVILHGRDEEKLKGVEREIKELGGVSYIVSGNLEELETLERLGKIAQERDISVLINNAAIGLNKLFVDFSDEEIEESMKVNLISPILLTKKIYPLMVQKGFGTIVNINSMDGLRVQREKGTTYCTSKFGLKGFTDSLRYESKGHGIRVMGVYLSGMATDMNYQEEENDKRMNPKEVAELIYESCVKKDSCSVDDITIGRTRY